MLEFNVMFTDGEEEVLWGHDEADVRAENPNGIYAIESLKPIPEFDQYYPGPVPLKALINAGHAVFCACCNKLIEESDDYVGEQFCSLACHQHTVNGCKIEDELCRKAARAAEKEFSKKFPWMKISYIVTPVAAMPMEKKIKVIETIVHVDFPGRKMMDARYFMRLKQFYTHPVDAETFRKWMMSHE